MRCAVVGAGAWGTALADLLARNEHEVSLWAYEADVVESINTKHENVRFLRGYRLSPEVKAVGEIGRAVEGADLIALATPSHVLRGIIKSASKFLPRVAPVVVATKGIERQTLCLMTEIVEQELPGATVVALSGPSFATEVVSSQPTAVVVASKQNGAAGIAQRAFSSAYFRTYTHTDVIGVELGGALKNVMAVATGIADGLGLGFNARAALITRGLAEMTRLGVALGAVSGTLAGLAGLGDLVLTCTGSLSRNRQLGMALAKGVSAASVERETRMIAEGARTVTSALALARRHAVSLPICHEVGAVLFEDKPPADALAALLERPVKREDR